MSEEKKMLWSIWGSSLGKNTLLEIRVWFEGDTLPEGHNKMARVDSFGPSWAHRDQAIPTFLFKDLIHFYPKANFYNRGTAPCKATAKQLLEGGRLSRLL